MRGEEEEQPASKSAVFERKWSVTYDDDDDRLSHILFFFKKLT